MVLDRKERFLKGFKAGIPIALGYLSVSFTLGIMGIAMGFKLWQTVLISMVTVTSAGQFAGMGIMMNPGMYMEMLVSQLTINVRYSFMSVSLSQKVDAHFKGVYRWLLGFFMTDEIFAVAVTQKSVTRSFFFGLAVLPYLGWSGGTLIGALVGNVLPASIMSALGLAIYGMFVAIVAPDAKKERPLLVIVAIALALSCAFYYVPGLKEISSGLSVSICAIIAAVAGALIFPVKEDK